MLLLAFETATPSGGVALIRDERIVGAFVVRASRQHSRLCLDAAARLLEAEGLNWSDIDVFAASHGPGSFTGVRIGMTHAKTLAFANSKRLVTVGTMQAMAAHTIAGDAYRADRVGGVLVLLDARRGELYAAVYAADREQTVREVVAPFCCAPEELMARLSSAGGTPTLPSKLVACGEGALLPGVLPASITLARLDRRLACPTATAHLALQQAQRGEWADPATAAPIYLREAVEPRVKEEV